MLYLSIAYVIYNKLLHRKSFGNKWKISLQTFFQEVHAVIWTELYPGNKRIIYYVRVDIYVYVYIISLYFFYFKAVLE